MDRNEYERRRRAVEEIYRQDLELVREAHEARVRSLEALWASLAAEPVPAVATAPPAAPEAPVPAAVPRPRPPHLRQAVEEVFSQLPDVFEKKDVVAALGWTPSRPGLYRVLLDLAIEGRLTITQSTGRHPSEYRKKG